MPRDHSTVAALSRRRAWERRRREAPEARQARLATASAHGQAVIRHILAWRLEMAARRATPPTWDPPTRI